MVVSTGKSEDDWKVLKNFDTLEIFDNVDGKGRRPFPGARDPRIYYIPNSKSLRMGFWIIGHDKRTQEQHYIDVHYNVKMDSLYVLLPSIRLHLAHEVGHKHQKNWSPFIYNHYSASEKRSLNLSSNESNVIDNAKAGSSNHTQINFFIYSIHPHRIVHGNESHLIEDSKSLSSTANIKTSTIVLTSIDKVNSSTGDIKPVAMWPYGQPRGGSPAILIDTQYGRKYLTFFHSSTHYMAKWCTTYFFGAYLFDPVPPFKITHFSREPIIPNPFYNISYGGWMFGNQDYVVFPMGVMVIEDIIFICTGKNDHSGKILTLKKKEFLQTLMPVKSEEKINIFLDYVDKIVVA